jgi:cytochrome c oxidase assembly protein subunit 11
MATSNRTLTLSLVAAVIGMVMLAYASVPLYRIFCRVTGFGGTTRRVDFNHSHAISDHTVTVRFDGTMDPRLPWKFVPVEKSVTVHLGENRVIAFRATNLANYDTEGQATYNVTPFAVGTYFNKIQCFCFEKQHLGPHETATMPVSFFIDPAMLDDPEARDVQNITLSYSFFSYESSNHSKLRATP